MKTLKLSLLFCLTLMASFAFAQDYNVTFRVDMQDVAGFTTPEVNGSFNGWCGGCNALTNTSGTIWETTLPIPSGSYDFKYAYDSWAGQEALVAGAGASCFKQNGDNTNRTMIVDADMVLDLVCWNSCHACVGALIPGCTDVSSESYDSAATVEDGSCLYDLTVNVDMNEVVDAFTTPEINGSFNGWCGGCNVLSDNGDGTWTGTFTYQAGSYEFKYAADSWNIQESLVAPSSCLVSNFGNVNRYIGLSGDTTLDLVCYNSCSACASAITGCMDAAAANYDMAATEDDGSCEYLLTVTVDMSQVTDAFTTPEINGNYNGWCGGCNPLSDNGDGTWSGTFQIPNGDLEYKFAADSWSIQEDLTGLTGCVVDFGANWNRVLSFTEDTDVSVVCWNSCGPCASAIPGCMDAAAANYNMAATEDNGSCEYLLTVTVDMSQVTDAFTTPEINGNYNGWCGGCNPLSDNGDGTWSGTFQIPNGDLEYKFAADSWSIQEDLTGLTGCVVDFGGNWNRVLSFTEDTDVSVVCWNSCDACTSAIPGCMDAAAANYNMAATEDNGSCEYLLTVTVDMSQVTDAFTTPEINGNYNGWCGGCNPLSDNGDGTWSGTFQIPNGDLEYKFAADSWSIQEDLTGLTGCVVDFGGNWNRVLSFTEDTDVSVVCWNSCDACAAPAADVRITAVDPITGDITLTNIGDADQDISAWEVCNFPAYASATGLGAPSILIAGASTTFTWAPVADADGELGLYTTGVNFGSSANIVDYLEWASTGHTRSSVAVTAGVWNTGDFVDGPAPYTFIGEAGDYGSEFWDVNNPTYNVTFVMDLSNETVNALGVNIAGTFNGFDPNGGLMTNNGDGTFSYTVNAEEGSVIEYKYINGNSFVAEETVPSECGVDNGLGGFNRTHTVGSADETLTTVCFSSCSACVPFEECNDVNATNYNAAATADTACIYNTTFTVDMNAYVPAFTILNVSGEWNGFCLDCNQLSDNGDGTWSGTFPIPAGDYAYKYQVDSFADQEILVAGPGAACFVSIGGFTNRVTTVEPVVLNDIPVVCWASCQACAGEGTPGCTDETANNYDSAADEADGSCLYDVTFQVDMSQVTDPFTTPEVNATFNGFCGDCNPMTDQGSGVWAVTLPLQEGYYEFKYTADGFAIQENLSSEAVGLTSCVTENFGFFNRYVNVTGDTVLDLSCYGTCAECPAAIPGCTDTGAQNYNSAAQVDDGSCSYLLTVTVNMSQVTEPFTTPEINGAYNGWCGGCNPLTDNGDGTWSGTFVVPNGEQQYKFAADSWNIQEDLTGVTGCTFTDGVNTNRVVNITGDTTVDAVCWGSCDDCEALGCTDPLFLEFDPYATTDDSSCSVLVVEGCAYADADNYDAAANTDDGSCVFTPVTVCAGDFNEDGFVNVSDLGGFLGAFGSACE